MGQLCDFNKSYAATPLPIEGTKTGSGNDSFEVMSDGDLAVILTGEKGGSGGTGGNTIGGKGGNGGHVSLNIKILKGQVITTAVVEGAYGARGDSSGPGGYGGAGAIGGGYGGAGGNRYAVGQSGNGGKGGNGIQLLIDGNLIAWASGGGGGGGGGTSSGNNGRDGGAGGGGGGTIANTGQSVSYTLSTSKKVLTEADGFEASNRQATAMERMATAFEKMVSGGAINNDNGSVSDTSMISVITGKAFNTFITGEKNSLGSWKSDGVTIINNDINDNYLQIIGKLSDIGFKEILIDGTKYIFNVIEEPNSTNVKVVF